MDEIMVGHNRPPDMDKLVTLQGKVAGHEHYSIFSQVWEMRKAVAYKRRSHRAELKLVS